MMQWHITTAQLSPMYSSGVSAVWICGRNTSVQKQYQRVLDLIEWFHLGAFNFKEKESQLKEVTVSKNDVELEYRIESSYSNDGRCRERFTMRSKAKGFERYALLKMLNDSDNVKTYRVFNEHGEAMSQIDLGYHTTEWIKFKYNVGDT